MSLPLAPPGLVRSAADSRSSVWFARALVREPLLHFLLLGGLLFLLHRFLAEPEHVPTISVSRQRQQELSALFAQRQGRPPTGHEQQLLVEGFIDDEVLFRESLRLELASQDPDLRDQMIAHMRALLQASSATRTPSGAELRAFYQQHRADYQLPETVSFVDHVVPAGPLAEETARTLLRRLQTGEVPMPPPVVYQQSSRAQLTTLLTAELGDKIMQLPLGSWQQLRARDALHLVRLDARVPEQTPDFDVLEERLIADLRIAETELQLRNRLSRLRAQFQVQIEERP